MGKYIDIDSLRKEINHRIDILEDMSIKCAKNDDTEMHAYYHGKAVSLQELLSFIDSFQQKQQEEPDKSLEEAAEKSAMQYYVDGGYSPFQNIETLAHNVGFIAGANWQKNQMMKKTVDGEVGYWNQVGLSILLDKSLEKMGYDENTKVKLIIVKED